MSGSERRTAVATGLLVVCAMVFTAFNARVAYRRAQRAPTVPEGFVSDWRTYAAAGHRIGPATAKVTVVVFFDYQCRACGVMARRLDDLIDDNPRSLAVVFRHFPLTNRPYSAAAARAAICASDQGRFQALHDLLLEEEEDGRLGHRPWTMYAAEAGVADTVAFASCLRDARTGAIIDADVRAAERLDASVTPTWLLNDEKYVGDVWDFDRIVEQRLQLRD